jgi:hypothetical protein
MVEERGAEGTKKRDSEKNLFAYKFVKQGEANNGWGAGAVVYQIGFA